MNKIKIVAVVIIILATIPLFITASSIWTGENVYYENKIGDYWNISASQIEKVNNPGDVYSIEGIKNFSAYMSNTKLFVGLSIEQSFYWFNKSRLGYVKLIKVTPGQDISFLFSEEKYVYCAEYDAQHKLLREGEWMTTGDRLSLNTKTEWIMMVFRNATGDLSDAAGQEYVITANDINNLKYKYLILKPFTYTFKLNGGSYSGNTGSFTINRLGVTKMTLPVPTKAGYNFAGWKATDQKIYTSEIPVEYNQALFCDATLEATWNLITPTQISLNKTDIVLEENSSETIQLTATVLPSNVIDKSVTWSSSNNEIATVNANGVITPHKSGKTIIKAQTTNGLVAGCTVHVMGFRVSLPEYCSLNECYEIRIDVFNNGSSTSEGRKRVILNTDKSVELVRVGDIDTSCMVLAESSPLYEGNYSSLQGTCIVNTIESTSVFYRLKTYEDISKNGDYEGVVTFNVSVQ